MSATTTTFRIALQEHLKTALGGQIRIVGGPIEDGQENRDIGCVWLEGKTPQPADFNNEVCTYGVRLFRAWQQSQGPTEQPRNLEALEQDVETLQTALKAVLTTAGHDFFQIQAIGPNYELQCVEAQLFAYQRNMGAAGG